MHIKTAILDLRLTISAQGSLFYVKYVPFIFAFPFIVIILSGVDIIKLILQTFKVKSVIKFPSSSPLSNEENLMGKNLKRAFEKTFTPPSLFSVCIINV
jgi:hypothetical protein